MFYRPKISPENQKLPKIFAIPKLHKNPIKFRYIAGANTSSIKPLQILLHKILCFIKIHFQNYCRISQTNLNKKCYYSVDNTYSAINIIRSPHIKIHTVATADFTTLFTRLPHDLIFKSLSHIIHICYNNSKKTYIRIHNNYINYTDQLHYNKHNISFDSTELYSIIKTVLNESYVIFAGHIFKQIQGVPMGGNASSDIADLTLSAMEHIYSKIPRNTINIIRYVDDILIFNENNFVNKAKSIYGNELELDITPNSDNVNFLDINITIRNGIIQTNVYDKTTFFNFKVNKFASLDSNISDSIHKNIISSQIARYAYICSNLQHFIHNCITLSTIYYKKGISNNTLHRIVKNTLIKNKHLLIKYIYPNAGNIKKLALQIIDHIT
ncbi:unnamed protein product [Anisakis simplex]|uniref:Reverse transcriptase domain-containing protein n=1 Tax=Anisakis simplex TaxID=6269 RepID=A0A3P6MZJ4_ANISI|nr:unnamed protein product [Anisakis simplex]